MADTPVMRMRALSVFVAAGTLLAGGTATAGPSRAAHTYPAPTTSGQTVRMHVGDKLTVHLRASFRPPTSTDRSVIHRINHSGGYPTSEDARATFKALSVGRATINSVTDAQCLHTTPRCEIAQQAWYVQIIVRP